MVYRTLAIVIIYRSYILSKLVRFFLAHPVQERQLLQRDRATFASYRLKILILAEIFGVITIVSEIVAPVSSYATLDRLCVSFYVQAWRLEPCPGLSYPSFVVIEAAKPHKKSRCMVACESHFQLNSLTLMLKFQYCLYACYLSSIIWCCIEIITFAAVLKQQATKF